MAATDGESLEAKVGAPEEAVKGQGALSPSRKQPEHARQGKAGMNPCTKSWERLLL